MHTLSAWFTRNPVAANLIMALTLVAGFFTLTEIRIEGFPPLPPRSVMVQTILPGSTPEQVDLNVSQKIVKSFEGMAGVKKSASISSHSFSEVIVEKTNGYDMDRFQNEIQSRIDAIPGLPESAERPTVSRDEFNVEALVVQIYGDTDPVSLQKSARLVKEKLLEDPVITKLSSFGFRPFEIRIEIDQTKLQSFGITLEMVAEILQANSLNYRTGELKSDGGSIIIQADREAYYYEDFLHMPITTSRDGVRITLKDIGTIVDGLSDQELLTRYNSQPSVGLQIYTTQKGDLLEVSDAAHRIINSLQNQLPEGVKAEIWGEYANYMRDRLQLLKTNGLQGLLIVFLLLALFLDLRLAFWVALGIPISISGVFLLMGERFLDYSLNDITTFGLIVVMGILVDDAVIVGESVFESRRKNRDPIEGTIEGVHRVSTATIFGCMTTIAAFYPLLLIENDLGKIFASFSVVVIIALLVSLIESKLILPAHLASISLSKRGRQNIVARGWRALQNLASTALATVNSRIYTPTLRLLIHHRYSALVVFATVGIVGIGAIYQQKIRTVFFPDIPGQIITVDLKMHSGSPLSLLLENIDTLETCGGKINNQLKKEKSSELPPVARFMTAVLDEDSAVIWAELQPEKKRGVGTMEVLKRWRDETGVLEGVDEISFSGSYETGGGFEVELSGRDNGTLSEAIDLFKNRLSTIKGVSDIQDDLSSTSQRIRLRLKEEAQHLGFTTRDLATTIGDGFGGLELLRVQRDGEELKVIIRHQESNRQYVHDLLQTKIATDQGSHIPLSTIAEIHYENEASTVYRRNGLKTIGVRAKLDKKELSSTELFQYIQEKIKPELQEKYPQILLRGAGELEEITEMKGGLIKALVVILLLIYVLLAIPLKSYWQPLVIMSVIPFGFVGAAIGHGLTGHTLSILSFFGMLAAMGIVINDSLVMLTRYNQFLDEKMGVAEALVKAGSSRFRAIFLTTVTTVCGLLPLLTEKSEQAQYLIPAAISLAFGELFATPITLCLIPLLIKSSDDFCSFLGFSTSSQRLAGKSGHPTST